ncbi:phosphoserine phosphatase [Pasteurella canis]|uniref:phosphoserine phosphatase n=1 Tax=Pasteurella canis TaxID=753 RepID=UPI001E46E4FB|nr:phosphoserine phosphatase [Pasteurella canis]GJJ80392.1 phosphoserine phosphatase [Pasteurella canis]
MQTQNLASITHYFPQFPNTLLPNEAPTQGTVKFILYGTDLNYVKLQQFQQKCGENFIILDGWAVLHNTVVLLQGTWQAEWLTYAHELRVDIAQIDFVPRLKQSGLLVMDMDSTAIQIECIDEIAKLAGTGELVSSITAQAMRGELDFEQSLRRRVATLQGTPEHILAQVRENLPLMPGLVETLKQLQQYQWKTAIASGGFTYFTDYLKEFLKLDYAVSNQFDIQNGILTGEIKGDVVDAKYKAITLQQLVQEYGIKPENTVAIGDGANDLAMMKVAGLGVALHAKPKVQQQAQIVVNFADFSALLCLLSANERLTKE